MATMSGSPFPSPTSSTSDQPGSSFDTPYSGNIGNIGKPGSAEGGGADTSARQDGDDVIARVSQSAHDTVDRLADGVDSAAETLKAGADKVRDTKDAWADGLRSTVRENPLAALAAALAIGVLFARLTS